MVELSVIIATRKPREQVEPIALLAADDFDDYEVIVCDEAGTSTARNAGIARASAEKLVFLDDDSRPRPGYLAAASAALDEWAVVAGNTIHPRDDLFARHFTRHYSQGDTPGLLDPRYHPIACNMAYRKAVFETVGGFDEGFDPWGHEEKELAQRVRTRYDIGYAPEMRVEHSYADSLVGYWYKQYRLERKRPYYWTTQGLSKRHQLKLTLTALCSPRSYVSRTGLLTLVYTGRSLAWAIGRTEGLLRGSQ